LQIEEDSSLRSELQGGKCLQLNPIRSLSHHR